MEIGRTNTRKENGSAPAPLFFAPEGRGFYVGGKGRGSPARVLRSLANKFQHCFNSALAFQSIMPGIDIINRSITDSV